MNKYGIENFSFEILEQCAVTELNNREQYWIKYYNSYEDGYNETIGGDGNKIDNRTVYQYDIYGNYIKQFNNIYEAHEEVGGSLTTLKDALKGIQKTAQGYRWFYEKYNNVEDGLTYNGVICFSLITGERLNIFPSINNASLKTGDTPESIKASCDNYQKNSGHYIWRYYKTNKNIMIVPTTTTHGSFKMIDQYDLQGNLLKTFSSITEIINTLQVSRISIFNCCTGKVKTVKGFQWRYHGDAPPAPYQKMSRTKYIAIQQLDLQNNIINEFKTIKEATIYINKKSTGGGHITECCQGKRKTYKGYYWRYKIE